MKTQAKRYKRIEIKLDTTDEVDKTYLELWKLAKRIAKENGMTVKGLFMKALEHYLNTITKGGEKC